ncbi:MAG: ferrochelatase [bacterium]|nr:ferrochelatase [bacterium]
MDRTAVVLFNLGGPDSPAAIQPFLNNLFNDPAIISIPWPLRPVLASVISHRRQSEAKKIYETIGGHSPLLENTRQQARALEAALDNDAIRVFVSMRYWHPMSEDTALEVAEFEPQRVVLLPLYPQFSTTTTASSMKEWVRSWKRHGYEVTTRAVCCWPRACGFVGSYAAAVRSALDDTAGQPARVLFSAHGLPEKIIRGGDPYQWQVEQTASAIVDDIGRSDLDWTVCYQSRVGPLDWIGPSTDGEIDRAGREGTGVVVVPVAFVSEHSETLVELDIEYRQRARDAGCPFFRRIPAVSCDDTFIEGLAALVRSVLDGDRPELASGHGGRICPASFKRCPLRTV